MQDPADPIHRVCDCLVESNVASENERLHSARVWAPWPDFLIAFASQGCGDYFAYDIRQSPPSVIYIDPGYTPEENLADPESVRYASFYEWYEAQLGRYTCEGCGSHDVGFRASPDGRWLLRVCSACGLEQPTDAIDP
jgi:hypothetical protein